MTSRKHLHPLVLVISLALASVITAPSGAAADPSSDPPLIVTYGNGAVHVRPDSLAIDVGIEARAASVELARRQANAAMKSVIDALHALALPTLGLDTRILSVSPVYGSSRDDRPPQIVGYAASNHLSVALEQVPEEALAQHASRIVDAALAAGANAVSSFEVYLADPTPAEDEALAAAVHDATHDAQIVARAAGVTLAGLRSLEQAPSMRLMPRSLSLSSVASTPVEIDDIIIESNVTARFAFH